MDCLEIHELLKPDESVFGNQLSEPYLTTDKVYFDKENERLYVLRDETDYADWYRLDPDGCITVEILEAALRPNG